LIGQYLSYQNSADRKNLSVTEPIFGSGMPQNLGLRCETKDLSGNPKKCGPKSQCSREGGQCGAVFYRENVNFVPKSARVKDFEKDYFDYH
jgi:hypothetical protein